MLCEFSGQEQIEQKSTEMRTIMQGYNWNFGCGGTDGKTAQDDKVWNSRPRPVVEGPKTQLYS